MRPSSHLAQLSLAVEMTTLADGSDGGDDVSKTCIQQFEGVERRQCHFTVAKDLPYLH